MKNGTLKQAWALARPYWVSSERWAGRFLLAAIVGLSLGEVYISVLLNKWNNDFYNSLQAMDKDAFMRALFRFSYLAGSFIVVAVYKTYLGQMLRIKWRRWMTAHYLRDWLAGKNYYRMRLFAGGMDNPDQRIAEDIEQFILLALNLSLGLLSAVVTLASFLGILWGLSGALDFVAFGHAVSIPGYMVWVAIVYAVFGTWLAVRIGRLLISLNFNQQRYEADFRFSLVRLRENSEGIAFYGGEAQEEGGLLARFGMVVGNFWQIMRRQKLLNWFTYGYGQIAIIFPYVVAAPRFFSGAIQLGGMMQTASAFGQVQSSLSYIVDSYSSIATWRAVIERLSGFTQHIGEAEALGAPAAGFAREWGAESLRAEGLVVRLPDGAPLLGPLGLAVSAGESLLISGPSGAGKSTLLRTLAGLWPFAEGRLLLPPREAMLFLPQKPYLPLGTLGDILRYPTMGDASDADVRAALAACGLSGLSERLSEGGPWADRLSLGEQQRLAFARLLLAKPRFAFLDEATSALDEAAEAALYGMLKQQLPEPALVSVGHRAALKVWHGREMVLNSLPL